MREIQFFSDVKWEIDKESFSGLETALQWVRFSTQLVEMISVIVLSKVNYGVFNFPKNQLDFVPNVCPNI